MAKDKKNKKEKPKKIDIPQAPESPFLGVEKFLGELYEIRNNVVSNQIECKRADEEKYEPLNENNIYRLLQHNNVRFSMGNLLALLRSDFVEKYNPFEEYFETLPKWNGKDHISDLCTYIKVKNQPRFNNHFKKMLVRSIACALDPDYFNKQLFLFMGGQNMGKTYFMRWLCPPELKNFYTENISTDKDSVISLGENFIINMDELAGLAKFELRALKSILSKDKIKIRLPFDKRPTLCPRRANFVGSTNEIEFLTDVTGTVRWLCFELTGIDKKYSKEIDITKLWSQAYHLYKTGFIYNITGEEIEENESVNVQHQVSTMETELIQKYFKPGSAKDHSDFWTSTDITLHLHTIGGNAVRINNIGIGRALTFLKYEQVSKRDEASDMPRKGYYASCQCKPCKEKRELETEYAEALSPKGKEKELF